MDYDSIAKAGSMLGSGAVIVMDDTRCMVESLLRLSYFYMHESLRPVHAVPRRHGLAVAHGRPHRTTATASRSDIDLLNSVADNIQGRTICALGDAAAMPVRAMIKHFRHEFEAMIDRAPAPAIAADSASGSPPRRVEAERRKHMTMIEIELDGQKVEVRRRQHGHACGRQGRHLHPALLLSQEAVASRPTAACAWSRSRRRPSRCRPARRR